MATSDVLAVVAATVVDDPRRACSRRARARSTRTLRDAARDRRRAARGSDRAARRRARRGARRRDRGRPRRPPRRRRRETTRRRRATRATSPRRSSRRWRSAPASRAPRNACAKASRPRRHRAASKADVEAGVIDVQAALLARRRLRARARLVVGVRRAGCGGSPARYVPTEVVRPLERQRCGPPSTRAAARCVPARPSSKRALARSGRAVIWIGCPTVRPPPTSCAAPSSSSSPSAGTRTCRRRA